MGSFPESPAKAKTTRRNSISGKIAVKYDMFMKIERAYGLTKTTQTLI